MSRLACWKADSCASVFMSRVIGSWPFDLSPWLLPVDIGKNEIMRAAKDGREEKVKYKFDG